MMSVELAGVQGYEYQYIVTVYLALLILEVSDSILIVERLGGEDAEIRYTRNGVTSIIEVQVKSYSPGLDLQTLVEWLCHFAARDADNYLLKRLLQDPQRIALFVTNARCQDDVVEFRQVIGQAFTPHANPPLRRGQHADFQSMMRSAMGSGASDLQTRRQQQLSQQADAFQAGRSRLVDVSKQVVIWEQLTRAQIEHAIMEILNRVHHVPQSQTEQVLLELVDAVREARDQHVDVMPLIRNLIRSRSGRRVFTRDVHVDRSEMPLLTRRLAEDHVLLLTGMPNCGKSHLAEWIAQEFQDRGYSCLLTDNYREAVRHLGFASEEDRLCILEDPFGAVGLVENRHELWTALESLVTRCASNRKLIVTSRSDVLQALRNTDAIEEWRVQQFFWIDLTVTQAEFSQAIWRAYALTHEGISDETDLHVTHMLQQLQDNDQLQPGQIQYLAKRDPHELAGKNGEELIRLARVDATKLGRLFVDREHNFQRLLIALGMGASTISSIRIEELQFILSNLSERPNRINREDDSEGIPDYPLLPELAEVYVNALEELEARGYMRFDNEGFRFAHPIYQEAAHYVIMNQGTLRIPALLDIFDRGVSCLAPRTAVLFSPYWSVLVQRYAARRKWIIERAIGSLDSIFLSVRDSAVAFLVTVLDELEEDVQQRVIHAVQFDALSERIAWYEGEACVNPNANRGHTMEDFYLGLEQRQRERECLPGLEGKLSNPRTAASVTPYEAWIVASNLRDVEDINQRNTLCINLMSYRESATRGAAAFFVMRHMADNRHMVETVLRDEHPHVVSNGVKGCFSGWSEFDEEVRSGLMPFLRIAVAQPAVAVALNRFMLDFADEHRTSRVIEQMNRDIWDLWAELIPAFLSAIPVKLNRINEGHLYVTFREAGKWTSIAQVRSIARAWYDWINECLSHGVFPHDYGFSLADFLLNTTGNNFDARAELNPLLLNHADTGFATSSLRYYVDHWQILSQQERDVIADLLQSERVDARWLRAVALTRPQVPEEIVEMLTGSADVLSRTSDAIISSMPPQLLEDCLHVYCGAPQPLWWLGYHHATDSQFREVFISMLDHPYHQAFSIALHEVVSNMLMPGYRDEERETVVQKWTRLCNRGDALLREQLFQELLKHTVQITGDRSEELWHSLFSSLDEDMASHYLDRIVPYIEALSWDNEDIGDAFGSRVSWDDLYQRLPADGALVQLLVFYWQDENPPQVVFKLMELLYQNSPPRMLFHHERCEFFCSKHEFEGKAELLALVEDARITTIDRGAQQKQEFDAEQSLEDWET